MYSILSFAAGCKLTAHKIPWFKFWSGRHYKSQEISHNLISSYSWPLDYLPLLGHFLVRNSVGWMTRRPSVISSCWNMWFPLCWSPHTTRLLPVWPFQAFGFITPDLQFQFKSLSWKIKGSWHSAKHHFGSLSFK